MKASTQQTLDYIKQIEDYIDSPGYKAQISGQDIYTDASPYKYGDQTLGDGIKSLLDSFKQIKDNLALYDKGSYDQRNAINTSYLANLVSWIQSPTSNSTNIIQYSNNIASSLFNLGINPSQKLPNAREVKKLLSELSSANDIISQTDKIRSLLSDLKDVKDGSNKIEQAKEIITFVENAKNIGEIESYVETGRTKIDTLIESARNLLGTASDAKIAQHFSQVSEKYKNELSFSLSKSPLTRNDTKLGKDLGGWFLAFYHDTKYFLLEFIILLPFRVLRGLLNWNFFVIIGVSLFIFNLYLIIEYKSHISIQVGDSSNISLQIISILANGLIRLTCLSPSIFLLGFILQNRNQKEKLRETYEFRSVSSKTISGHIEMLKNNGIIGDKLNEFIINAFTNIYTEPNFSKSNHIDAKEKLLDIDKFTKLADSFTK